MKPCEICGRPLVPPGCATCGASECQEASHYANLARNARGKKQGPAIRLAAEKAETARYWAGRREGGRSGPRIVVHDESGSSPEAVRLLSELAPHVPRGGAS